MFCTAFAFWSQVTAWPLDGGPDGILEPLCGAFEGAEGFAGAALASASAGPVKFVHESFPHVFQFLSL
jgi:hypothetical protein